MERCYHSRLRSGVLEWPITCSDRLALEETNARREVDVLNTGVLLSVKSDRGPAYSVCLLIVSSSSEKALYITIRYVL